MSGPEFFQTRMGQVFFEGTMPALVRELKRLNDNLGRMNKLLEESDGSRREPEGAAPHLGEDSEGGADRR